MEEVVSGKPLTQKEKEELKEQLAYLKREYSKTFQRLQRAERAERVKNNVKKRTVEQNGFLPQTEAEKDPEESTSQTPSETSLQHLERSAFLDPNIEKAALFGPEVLVKGGSFQENSGSERSTPEDESSFFCPIGPRHERKSNRLSRSGAKSRRRVTLALGGMRELASEGLLENAGHDCGCDTTSTGSSGSPTFKKRFSTFEAHQSLPNTEEGSHGVVVADSETSRQHFCVEASSPPSNVWLHRNQVPSLNSDENPVAPNDVQCKEQLSVQAEKEPVEVCEEEPSEAVELVGANGAPFGSGCGMLEVQNHFGETKNLDLISKTSSLRMAGELGQESQGKAGPSHPDKALPVPQTESSLSTCTVVEGLLFPVEYYVRITRRMSRCQKDVDLSAVLQHQLGRRKKGQRASRKEKGANPDLQIQEPSGSECQLGTIPIPSSDSCESPGCDAASPFSCVSPGCDPPSVALGRGRRGRRPRGRGGCRASPGAFPELTASKDHLCLISCEAEGREAAVPVGAFGSLEAQPAEPTLAANKHSEAETEGIHDSCTTMTATSPAISCSRSLEVNSSEMPCSEKNTQEQCGPQNSRGSKLPLMDEALLPQCKPVDAAQKNMGTEAALGGKESSLLEGSQDHPEPLENKSELPTQKDLPSPMHLHEFHFPEGEHGLPESCAIEQVEVVHSAKPVGSLHCACPGNRSATGVNLGGISQAEEPPRTPPIQQMLHKKDEVLLSPNLEDVTSQLESQLSIPVFPQVGATPASHFLPCVSPLQVKGSGYKPEDGTRCSPKEAAGVGLEERQTSAGLSPEHSKESAQQIATAVENGVEALLNTQREGNVHLTAKLKASFCSGSVDVSAVWWESGGPAEFCIAVACEASVSLWRCLEADHWAVLHTWDFVEVPVSQIVPLPDVHSILCVAMGKLKITQIRFLFQSSENGSFEQSQVKRGDIKAILGLKNRRLVVSCGSIPKQTVEVVFFSEGGRIQKRYSLKPPHENILTFAEVDGMPDALVGLTPAKCVIVWNLKTRQLLRRIPVGQPDPISVCHKAFSDSGLLFVVFSHPHTEESEADRTTIFQVIALNPKTAKSAGVAHLSLPLGIAGRYVEGTVRGTSAAAVLTTGKVVVWDLLLGQCTALLPPNSKGSCSLVRWSVADDCLLVRRTDGGIYLYSYKVRLPSS